ncbi:hypothetical protein GOP47_0016327 [Adiantum capillus-veneris]|uniref:Myb/SANT-like DNA-binding domain-containing protein n=1 Tax=Adiantum capillus-veneris TaxID=13818 RepID=A0A9D4UHW1_ADICA|nr:hypothetical protein GOP47_0016327 [Adiantum capillus-veneris]
MEVCYAEQDPNSSVCQFGAHSHGGTSHVGSSQSTLSASAVGGGEQTAVLDSSRVAMQIASDQVVWPIIPKPNEVIPKIEPENQQSLPFVDANSTLHLNPQSADFALRHADTPIEKCKVRKRRLTSEDGEALDGDGTSEKQSIMRWKDEWVAQLIHIKGRAQAAVSGPQKQRVDLWQVIKSEMARTCHGFDKDSEACRKKWRRVYKEYKDDKCLRAAGNGSQKCKFYDLMDFYMGEKTSGTNNMQLTAIGCNNSHVLSPGKGDQHPDIGEEPAAYDASQALARFYMPGAGQPPSSTGEAHATKRPYRRANSHAAADESAASSSLSSMLAEFVGLGKEMLNITRRYEQETVDLLHSMKEALPCWLQESVQEPDHRRFTFLGWDDDSDLSCQFWLRVMAASAYVF